MYLFCLLINYSSGSREVAISDCFLSIFIQFVTNLISSVTPPVRNIKGSSISSQGVRCVCAHRHLLVDQVRI